MYIPLDESHFWPGGIPSSLRLQPEPELSTEQIKQDSKENWVTAEAVGITGDSSHYNLRQRRELIVKWAEAKQSFRDSYHDRAPTPDPRYRSPVYPIQTVLDSQTVEPKIIPSYGVIVLPEVDQSHPVNYVHWMKTLLLFNRFDGSHQNILRGSDPPHHLVMAWDSVGSQSATPPVDKNDAARWTFLENANFDGICMTRQGMVLIIERGYFFMLDQSNLDEGTISIVEFGPNGGIRNELRHRPYFMSGLLVELFDHTPLEDLLEEGWDIGVRSASWRQLDINAPVLEMLETAKAEAGSAFRSPHLAEEVEHYAPGYLSLEAQGREAEYDIARLTELCFAEL